MFPMMRNAEFSQDHVYRYSLNRIWKRENGLVNFIMLNPSTADETTDDQTIRRCIGYTDRWKYGGLIVTNLFAIRFTDPSFLKKHADPVGPDNNSYILKYATECDKVICAWGNHGCYRGRDREVVSMLWDKKDLFYLSMSKFGQPSHPLRLNRNLVPQSWLPGVKS